MDLDSWNISLFPADLYQIWSDVAPIQLVSHSPIASIKDDVFFKDWVFIGQCPAYLRIAPEFKQPLFHHLLHRMQYQIFLSDFPSAFIRGNQLIDFRTLVSALDKIGCPAVRVQAYGMKQSLNPQAPGFPLGNAHHPLAKHNTFDLGTNYASNNIALVQPRHKTAGITTYPMLTPIGQGFGSVHMSLTLDNHPFLVKAYPRLVHSIKSISGNQMLSKPSSNSLLKRRQTTWKAYVHLLNTLPPSQLGGVRLEITVQASNLHQAIHTVNVAGILDINMFLQPSSQALVPFRLLQKQISKEEYISNCQALMAQAEAINIFHGRNSLPAAPLAQQAVVDLFNALGWNNGRNKITPFDKPDAWWIREEEEEASIPSPAPVTAVTMHHITGVQAMVSFFLDKRAQMPCHSCQHPPPAYINHGGKMTFKIKCSHCKAVLTQHSAREYFTILLNAGTITLSEAEAPPREATPPPPASPEHPAPALPAPAPLSDEEDEDAPPRRSTRRSTRAAARRIAAASQRRPRQHRQRTVAASPSSREEGFSFGSRPFVEIPILLASSPEPASPSPEAASPEPAPPAPVASSPETAPEQPRKTVSFAAGTKPGIPQLIKPKASIANSTRLSVKHAPRISRVIQGDGNCMFRAVSLHLYGTQDRHMTVRSRAIHHLREHPELLVFDTEGNSSYLERMERQGTWGDEIMLQAIAGAFNTSLFVYSGGRHQPGYSVTYPHTADGPHYGLYFVQATCHYEVLF